jgi:hypothetical protein
MATRNRRERRAAARDSTKPETDTFNPNEIPMVTPDYDAKPTGKTLYQIVDERYAELKKQGQPFPKSQADGDGVSEVDFPLDGDPLGAFANAVIYCISLSMLHVTLDVIVLSQYQQDIVWSEIIARIARMTPGLFLVLWLFHTEAVKRWHRVRQAFFLITSVVAGCYLIHAGNKYGYYFVMKKAPPVGTLWVWSVVEMDLWFAVAHAVAVVGYMWWGGYRAF